MGKGKSKGKLLFSVAGFFLGAGIAGQKFFGMVGKSFASGLMGASLAGTMWSTFKGKKNKGPDGAVQRFDKLMNTVSTAARIPIIYGERKVGGIQTYHKPNPDLNMLRKHVILCEAGIEGVVSVTANDLIIPDKPQEAGTVFTIQNVKYSDAKVSIYRTNKPTPNDKDMVLYANGKEKRIILASYKDADRSDMFEYNINIASLVSYINQLGDGWQAYPYATASSVKSPEDIYDINGASCYIKPIPAKVDSVRGESKYTFHDGDLPDVYMETGSYKGCAWLDLNLAASQELNGNPDVVTIIRGLKVLDFRTGKKEYSTNNAMCLLDFLTNERYGLGWDISIINIESFKQIANECDKIIEFMDADGTIIRTKKYELNIVIDQEMDARDAVAEILSSFCGFLTLYRGVVSLHMEKESPVRYSFNENNIIKESFSTRQTPIDESYNKFNINYVDPLNNWKSTKAIVENTADQLLRGMIIEKDVTLEGVTSQNQVLRLGRFYTDLVVVCSEYIQFSTGAQALHLEPGDVIKFSWYNVIKDALFRIIEIKEEPNGTIGIRARNYNESIYNDALGARIQWYNYTQMETALTGRVPNVSNLILDQEFYHEKDGTVVSNLYINFDIPKGYSFLDKWYIYYSIDGQPYQLHGSTIENFVTIEGVKTLHKYRVKVITENTAGRRSNGIESEEIFITGKDTPPKEPKGLKILEYDTGIILSWEANKEKDISGYDVLQVKGSGDISLAKLISEEMAGTSLVLPITDGAKYSFYVVAIDNSGNKSTPALIEYCPSIPDNIEFFDVVQLDSLLDFRWTAVSGCRYEIRRGLSWECGEKLVKVANNYYQCLYPVSGSHTFWIKAINGYNRYSNNAISAEITILEDNTRNAIFTKTFKDSNWQETYINMHIEPSDGLLLDNDVSTGEYYVSVNLPKKVKARNWLKTDIRGTSGYSCIWDNADFGWGDVEGEGSWSPTGDISGVTIANQISIKTELPQYVIESFPLCKSLTGEKNITIASEAKSISYRPARFRDGLMVKDTTKVSWNVKIKPIFHTVFYLRLNNGINFDAVIMQFKTAEEKWLKIGYRKDINVFYLLDSDGNVNKLSISFKKQDYLCIAINQSASVRGLYVKSLLNRTIEQSTEKYPPIGEFSSVYCYQKN